MIQSLKLESYRGFRDTTIEFSDITCIVGENSTGKSTIIEAIRDLLSSPNNPIPQNHCKVGINDNNATSLSLAFRDEGKLSKNTQNCDLQKPDLADFFVNEAEDGDYEFFTPVIDKIKEIL